MKFSEIIAQNQTLKEKIGLCDYKIALLSNTIVSQSQNILEYTFRKQGIKAEIHVGDYDNIVQDSSKYHDSNCAIIFWELANLIDGFQYKADIMSEGMINELVEKTKNEISYCFDSFKNTPLVIFNRFSTLLFNSNEIRKNKFDEVCDELNAFVESKKPNNTLLIDIDKVIAKVGIDNSIDTRYFYSSKALYTLEFYKTYANFIAPILLSTNGKTKKALIFDCDNTLWKGTLGEDGETGIEMSAKTPSGVVFEEIQSVAVNLAARGIIIGICSKNNYADVKNILDKHPDMILRDEHIVIKRINWNDKVSNLKEIAQELNIGLDSIIFVDDSDFEINLINQKLPEVLTLHVPKKLSDYPKLIRENLNLFFNLSVSNEDIRRTADYKNQSKREEIKNNFENIEDYLMSLEIRIKIYHNHQVHISRIAQLTQKTNQFNLTTTRYTESDISSFMENGLVLSINVEDKFGDSGLTGVIILNIEKQIASIDTFLMSCRIIGRNIEFAIMDYLINWLKVKNIKKCTARFIKTLKNSQVENFYDLAGFQNISDDAACKDYVLEIDNYMSKNLNYIGVEIGTET